MHCQCKFCDTVKSLEIILVCFYKVFNIKVDKHDMHASFCLIDSVTKLNKLQHYYYIRCYLLFIIIYKYFMFFIYIILTLY